MKLVTINTHSLIEENYQKKLEQFVDFTIKENPDIIAMQEVNQSIDAPVWHMPLTGFSPSLNMMPPIRKDNHALQAAMKLLESRNPYYWTWLPVKLGYSKYDEGMAIFSKRPITEVKSFYISKFEDYNYWKTRQVLGVKVQGSSDWFYTVHMGWWDDKEDCFKEQWERFQMQLQLDNLSYNIWLLGDFNSPAEVRMEGYDLIKNSGFNDTYFLAKEKDCGITVEGVIDGWRDKVDDINGLAGMRIDQIWCKHIPSVRFSKVIFNGQNTPIISDHFGVMIEIDESVFNKGV